MSYMLPKNKIQKIPVNIVVQQNETDILLRKLCVAPSIKVIGKQIHSAALIIDDNLPA